MDFPPGSIVKRRLHGLAGVCFFHMGVHVGGGRVIHFGGEKKDKGSVLCNESLTTFAAGRTVLLHASPRNEAHARAVCAEAQRVFSDGRNGYNHRYDFARNNCEDFCVATYEVCYG